jgi:hypothetical protein
VENNVVRAVKIEIITTMKLGIAKAWIFRIDVICADSMVAVQHLLERTVCNKEWMVYLGERDNIQPIVVDVLFHIPKGNREQHQMIKIAIVARVLKSLCKNIVNLFNLWRVFIDYLRDGLCITIVVACLRRKDDRVSVARHCVSTRCFVLIEP